MTTSLLFPLSFSPSMLNYSCELRWFRNNVQRYVPKGFLNDTNIGKSSDLVAGGLFAEGVELVRNAYFLDGLEEEDAIEKGFSHIIRGESIQAPIKTNERMAKALRRYFQVFPLEEGLVPCQLSDGTVAVEYRFEFDLGIPHPDFPERNILFVGVLDMLAERKLGSYLQRVVLDEKTTSSVSRIPNSKDKKRPLGYPDLDKEANLYKTDSQFIAYHWAARELGVATDTTIIRKIPISATEEDAFEIEVPITDFMIQIWYSNLINNILDLKAKYLLFKENQKRGQLYPQFIFPPILSGRSCSSFGQPCLFVEGCLSSQGEHILSSCLDQAVYSSKTRTYTSLEETLNTLKEGK